jgi:hypothetical protein
LVLRSLQRRVQTKTILIRPPNLLDGNTSLPALPSISPKLACHPLDNPGCRTSLDPRFPAFRQFSGREQAPCHSRNNRAVQLSSGREKAPQTLAEMQVKNFSKLLLTRRVLARFFLNFLQAPPHTAA